MKAQSKIWSILTKEEKETRKWVLCHGWNFGYWNNNGNNMFCTEHIHGPFQGNKFKVSTLC